MGASQASVLDLTDRGSRSPVRHRQTCNCPRSSLAAPTTCAALIGGSQQNLVGRPLIGCGGTPARPTERRPAQALSAKDIGGSDWSRDYQTEAAVVCWEYFRPLGLLTVYHSAAQCSTVRTVVIYSRVNRTDSHQSICRFTRRLLSAYVASVHPQLNQIPHIKTVCCYSYDSLLSFVLLWLTA